MLLYFIILCILPISFLNSLYDTFLLNLFESVVLNVSMEFDFVCNYSFLHYEIYLHVCIFVLNSQPFGRFLLLLVMSSSTLRSIYIY